ncbi:hypothetical protein CVM73_27240 [Bradyrhizobium forestalis]|uniref:Uncharacterized protein n=1 Tax=Bradyrhizobium forestalis TaxID=1419263 RepID=A0A2M8R330_9BRAD|nr:hypothetical protein CVM73_27240 [Bradyrhizobium forestalis]
MQYVCNPAFAPAGCQPIVNAMPDVSKGALCREGHGNADIFASRGAVTTPTIRHKGATIPTRGALMMAYLDRRRPPPLTPFLPPGT